MPSQKNIDQLQKIKDKLDTISSIILVDYSGVSVSDQQSLRKDLAENENSFNVTKNTLTNLALGKRSPEVLDSLQDHLQGPTATIYVQDIVSAAKSLEEFQKEHQSFKIKIGVSLAEGQDKLLTVEEITTLSKLPSKEQLYAELLSQMNAPAQSLVRVITAPIQNLVYLLQNYAERG
jgi:large subunit ribosomal protein L10